MMGKRKLKDIVEEHKEEVIVGIAERMKNAVFEHALERAKDVYNEWQEIEVDSTTDFNATYTIGMSFGDMIEIIGRNKRFPEIKEIERNANI
jgi:hypothetical protein